MRLKIPPHFQIRMQERSIPIDDVKSTISSPDSSEETFEGRTRSIKMMPDGRKLVVIYCKDGFRDRKDEYIVITAYRP